MSPLLPVIQDFGKVDGATVESKPGAISNNESLSPPSYDGILIGIIALVSAPTLSTLSQ